MSTTVAPSSSRTLQSYTGRVTEMFLNDEQGGNGHTRTEESDPLSLRVAAAEAAEVAARASSQAKTDLLAMMGHELKTPLNAISGYVQLLTLGVYGPVSPDQHGILMRVDRAQRHLLRLVTDLTDVLRLESGHLAIHVTEVELSDLVPDLESMIGPQARARSISFVASCGAGCVVMADRERLLQILINLLSNAVKYTPPGGTIEFDCPSRKLGGDDPGMVRLRVRDTGPGIPIDRQSAIFEPFVQLESPTPTRPEGVGLGLSISRDLARAMDGELRVRSDPGAGSSFTLSLPRAHSAC